jgi:hypothetical protein
MGVYFYTPSFNRFGSPASFHVTRRSGFTHKAFRLAKKLESLWILYVYVHSKVSGPETASKLDTGFRVIIILEVRTVLQQGLRMRPPAPLTPKNSIMVCCTPGLSFPLNAV